MSEPSSLYEQSTQLQKIAGGIAFVFASATLIMTAYWAHGPNTDEGYLGGLNMNEEIFNWHPVLMVAGMFFCLITSMLSYRILPLPQSLQKTIHILVHSAAIVCISIGLACVLASDNKKSKNPYNSYAANFWSIHSFVGICAICLYGLNFLLGIFHYLLPGVSLTMKQNFMLNHVFLGTFILITALSALESGIMLMTSGCSYNTNKPDYNPAEKYHLLNDGCQLANNIGIIAIISVFFCLYALFRFYAGKSTNSNSER